VPRNYAIKMAGTAIYVAFEDDADSHSLAAVLSSIETTRDAEWASKALVHMDDRRVAAILERPARQPIGENQHRDRLLRLDRLSGRPCLLGDNEPAAPYLRTQVCTCTFLWLTAGSVKEGSWMRRRI
jgi:hypothetical protein